jgi:hypothetical protein
VKNFVDLYAPTCLGGGTGLLPINDLIRASDFLLEAVRGVNVDMFVNKEGNACVNFDAMRERVDKYGPFDDIQALSDLLDQMPVSDTV